MERRSITVGEGFGHAIAAFFRDLAAGDPVPVTIVLFFVAVLVGLGVYGFVVMKRRQKNAAAFAQKQRKKQQADDDVFARMKKSHKEL